MHTKPMLWVLLVALCSSAMLSGCQSSKTAFGNSYYFKQTPKSVDQQTMASEVATSEAATLEKVAPQSAELYTSLEKETMAERDAGALIEQAQQQLLAAVEKTENTELKEKALRMNQLMGEMNGQELTKKEAKAKRKEVRSLVKEYKSMSPNETNDMEKNLLLSIILLGGGLLMFFIFWPLGALMFLAGLVFLIIWAAS